MNERPIPESDSNEIIDVLIVGAGPAGLTASYLLTKKSRQKVVVLGNCSPGVRLTLRRPPVQHPAIPSAALQISFDTVTGYSILTTG